jgi:hypothetical protein
MLSVSLCEHSESPRLNGVEHRYIWMMNKGDLNASKNLMLKIASLHYPTYLTQLLGQLYVHITHYPETLSP